MHFVTLLRDSFKQNRTATVVDEARAKRDGYYDYGRLSKCKSCHANNSK